jgi:hypothetical protein
MVPQSSKHMAARKFNTIEMYDILGIRLRWDDYSFWCSESGLSSVIFFEENPETYYCVSSRAQAGIFRQFLEWSIRARFHCKVGCINYKTYYSDTRPLHLYPSSFRVYSIILKCLSACLLFSSESSWASSGS